MTTTETISVDEFLAHSPATVWRALTDADLLASWLMPNEGFAPIVGTRFTFQAEPVPNAGFSGRIACEVLEVEPEHRFRISWASPGSTLDSTVTWTLVPEGTGTRLLLAHEGFDPDDPTQAMAFEIMGRGWRSHILRRMQAALAALD